MCVWPEGVGLCIHSSPLSRSVLCLQGGGGGGGGGYLSFYLLLIL